MAVSTTYVIMAIVPLVLLLAIYLIIVGTREQGFTTILCLSYFSACFTVGSVGLYFIIPFVGFLKNISHCRFNKVYLFCILISLLIFSVWELSYSTPGRLLERLSYLLYFFTLLSAINPSGYNHTDTVMIFIVVLAIVNIFAIQMSGGIAQFLVENAVNIRMGDADMDRYKTDTLDGSMGFPIHTILMMSLSYPIFLGKQINLLWKSLLGLGLIIMIVVTFLTTSKVYLLGLATFSLCIIPVLLKNRRGIIITILVAVFIFLHTQSWLSEMVYDRYYYRLFEDTGTDITSGRSDIFKSCIKFLAENPLELFFGMGYDSYVEYGRRHNLAFQFSAHNIFLDGLMTYGIYGCLLFIIALNSTRQRFKRIYKTKGAIIGWIPLVCWVVMCTTNTPFYLAKTYTVLPLLIFHTVCYRELQIKH